ncbi:MAG: chitobiase/beta-hexosaminidase C-terminal domain-containing protein [bacterium]|nr:chitobiase/beta-hexosaminidase C-terminal domain-containing protein [bacterium]
MHRTIPLGRTFTVLLMITLSSSAAPGPASLELIASRASGSVLRLAYTCIGAAAIRFSEQPNLVHRDWIPYSGSAIIDYPWLGPAGTGTLYLFARDTAGAIFRTNISVFVPFSVVDHIWLALYSYFTNPATHRGYLPLGAYPGNVLCNTTEIGLSALSFLLAYDQRRPWSPTWDYVYDRLLGVLSLTYQWLQTNKTYQNHAYYQFYDANNQSVVNYNIPSVDNALWDACLMTIAGYCRQRPWLHGAATITNLCALIMKPRNYSIWYNTTYHRFGWLTTSPGSCDYYSGENRIINFVARAFALHFGTWNLSSNEFALSLKHPYLQKPLRSYDGISVAWCNWDGSLFTYLLPAQFVDEIRTVYGTNTIGPAVAAQIRYMQNMGRHAFGISDGPPPPGIQYQMGCPPRASNSPSTDPDTGCVNPGSLAMCLITPYRPQTIDAFFYLLTNKSHGFSPIGFRGTISVTSDAIATVWSELDNGHAMLGLANAARATAWNAFYAFPSTYQMHLEAYGPLPDAAPPVVGLLPTGGFYDTSIAVTVVASDAMGSGISNIFFTLDGSDPWTSTTRLVYSTPFWLSTDTIVRVVALDNAGNESEEFSASYVVVPEPLLAGGVFLALIAAHRRRLCSA